MDKRSVFGGIQCTKVQTFHGGFNPDSFKDGWLLVCKPAVSVGYHEDSSGLGHSKSKWLNRANTDVALSPEITEHCSEKEKDVENFEEKL